jgi:hypothetical protein
MRMAADRLNELGIGRVLRAAEAANRPDAFKKILRILFIYLEVGTPNGVFSPEAPDWETGSADLKRKQ